jgi:hypothetical protein
VVFCFYEAGGLHEHVVGRGLTYSV